MRPPDGFPETPGGGGGGANVNDPFVVVGSAPDLPNALQLQAASSTLTDVVSKTIIAGHSYNMVVQNVIGAGYNPNGFFTNGGSLVDRGQWPCMIQDVIGIGADRKYVIISIPNNTALVDFNTYVPVEEDCFVEACSFYPAAGVALVATNFRTWSISVTSGPGSGGWQTIGLINTNSGSPIGRLLIAGQETPLVDLCEVTPNVLGNDFRQAFQSSAGVNWAGSVVCPGGQTIRLSSVHSGGTGQADPGGVFVIRLGGRFRNYSVGGASHTASGVYQGGWPTSMNPFWNPRAMLAQNSALPANLTARFASTQATAPGNISGVGSTVTVTSTADFPAAGTFSLWTNIGAVTVTYTGGGGGGTTFTGCTGAVSTYVAGNQACATTATMQAAIFGSLGAFLIGPNGTVAAVTNIIAFGTVALTTTASSPAQGGDHGSIAAGLQAQLIGTTPPFGYETPTGHGLAMLLTGINDCGVPSFDIVAWRECLRAWAAFHACSGFWSLNSAGVFDANIVTANGTGAWATVIQPAWGQFGGGTLSFTGAPSAASKLTLSLGPGYSGGPIDLFFLAWGGSSDGGTASITVDGAQPPQGAVTVQTTAASPTSLLNSQSVAWSGAGTTTLTRTAGTFSRDDVGKKVKGTSIPNATYIQSWTDSTHVVCNNVIPATTGVAVQYGAVPMVKRLVGLAAGAHTIEVTVTAMFATDGSSELGYLGYGLEPVATLLNPVVICNVARILSLYPGSFDPNPNAVLANAEIPKVIAGTATPVAGNTQEPALSAFTVIADIDTAINRTPAYFSNDGLHPNTLGHAIIANTVLAKVKATISQLQSMAR